MFFLRQENRRTCFFKTEEHENMFFLKDRRTEEHVFGEKTGEHITPLPMGGGVGGMAFILQ